MSFSGAMCSVMVYSNLALGGDNQVRLEFSTPHGIAPDGILLCATATGHRFDRTSFVVNNVEEGGSQFISGTSTTVASVADSDLVRAFSGATSWNHRPVEVGVAADVLGLDYRYADTYARGRYDDMTQDAAGNSFDGVFQDPAWSTDTATRTAASDVVIASLADAETDTARTVLFKQLEELNRPSGNCALLTGTWIEDTRYELKITTPNPSTDALELGWWMAPVSYAAADAVLQRLQYASGGTASCAAGAYQQTALSATADGLDVTPLVSFAVDDATVAAVSGETLTGVSPGAVAVFLAGRDAAFASATVGSIATE